MAYSGGSARTERYFPVFPQPLIRERERPQDCVCTWAYSPNDLGTKERPFVLKVRWTICPVHRDTPLVEEAWRELNYPKPFRRERHNETTRVVGMSEIEVKEGYL